VQSDRDHSGWRWGVYALFLVLFLSVGVPAPKNATEKDFTLRNLERTQLELTRRAIDSQVWGPTKPLFKAEAISEAAASDQAMPWVVRTAALRLDPQAVEGDSFVFNPFPDHHYLAVRTASHEPIRHGLRNIDAHVFSGELLDELGHVVGEVQLVVTSGPDFGASGRFILHDGESFLLRQNSEGQVVVDQVQAAHLAQCGGAPEAIPVAVADEVPDGDGPSDPPPPPVSADGDTIVDVLVVYTAEARSAAGGTAAMQSTIAAAVAASNTTYSNSEINAQIRLVGSQEVSYTESGNFNTDLSRLRSTSDGYMDDVHTLRDTYGADMVALFINNTAYCGLAYVMPSLNATYSGSMFSANYWYCTALNLTLAHELGHNMGAQHDSGNAGSSGLYAYSYGHHFPQGSGGSRSVMAYNIGGEWRRSHFSNPNVNYSGNNQATGTATANNASTLNDSMPFIAEFKDGTYSVSGTILLDGSPLAGVTVDGGALGSTTTDSSGNYSLDGLDNGDSYTLTPTLGSYSFSPESYSGTIAATDVDADFTASNDTQAPATPSGLTATDGTSTEGIMVTWNANADATSYQLYRSTSSSQVGSPLGAEVSGVSYIDLSVTAGTTYYYRIAAINAGGGSSISSAESGWRATGGSSTDTDGDGRTDDQENILGTTSSSSDTDGDGVSDGQEVMDGTNPLDAGSAMQVLGTNVCSEWNGNFSMLNILELVNMSGSTIGTSSQLYSRLGEAGGIETRFIDSGAQVDVGVHDMDGRDANTYGQVCTSHGAGNGALDGRMVYYHQRNSGEFDFAFSLPFLNGQKGPQFVPFNTNNPALNGNNVANWIQITNLDSSEQSGTLTYYNLSGSVIASQVVFLDPAARADYGVHDVALNQVGLVRWVPNDSSAEFQLRNVRYIYAQADFRAEFDTAFQLEGIKGSGELLSVPLDPTDGFSYLEVSNVSSSSTSVTVNFFTASGALVETQTITLAARASQHFPATSLGSSLGLATVDGASANSIIATGMNYGVPSAGVLEWMYGDHARQAVGTTLRSSYNTWLNQGCTLVVANPTINDQDATLDMVRSSGLSIISSSSITVPARGLYTLDLCSSEADNYYGVVTVTAGNAGSLQGQVIRLGSADAYRFPTPLRP